MKKVFVVIVMMVMFVMGAAMADEFSEAYANVEKYVYGNGLKKYEGIGLENETVCRTSCVIDTEMFLEMFPEYSEFNWDFYTIALKETYPDWDVSVNYGIVDTINGTDVYFVVITENNGTDIVDWREGVQNVVEIYCALI